MAKSITKKKGKAKWVILTVILLIVCLMGACIYKTSQTMKQLTTIVEGGTATVTTRTLIKSIGATGKIKSNNKKDISVELTGVKLSAVNVALGDVVEKDQLLVTFDTSDIEESLADAEASLDKTNSQNKLTQNSTNRSVADTKRQAEFTIENAKDSVDSAKESYDEAVSNLSSYRSQYDNYQNQANSETANIETLNVDIKTQTTALKSAKKELDAAKASLSAAVSSYEAAIADKTEDEISDGETRGWDAASEEAVKEAFDAVTTATNTSNQLEKKVNKAQSKLDSLNTSLAKAETYLATLQAKLETLNTTIEKVADSVDQLKKSYDSAVKSYDNTVASQESAIASAKDSAKSTELNLEGSTKTYEKQIETYTEQLENGKLYSPISGVVTAINYSEGDTYTTGTIITVQDTSDFFIEAEVSEYDIADIVTGQKVLIKTDATGEEEMNGTVFFVAPTASTPSTGSATYTVKISIDNPSDRLRLDMSASLSIIIEQHDNALTVPYTAVSTDEDGKAFVLLQKDDGSIETVYVDILMESNYYTEISSDRIKDGDTLQVIPTDSSTNYWDSMDEEGFIF